LWRERPVSEISKRDVMDLIEGIDARGSPGAAKRALAYLRKFFNWCAERDIISIPATDRIRPPHPEMKRDRVLTEQELVYVMRAINDEKSIFGPLIRFLLCDETRRSMMDFKKLIAALPAAFFIIGTGTTNAGEPVKDTGAMACVTDKWDEKEPEKGHKLVDAAMRCVLIPDDPVEKPISQDCAGRDR
jgi:hypothetical protein